jgi:hypothetical protein
MVNKKVVQVLFIVLFISVAFFLIDQNRIFGEMSGMQDHQHHTGDSMYKQTNGTEEAAVELKTEPASIKAGNPATLLLAVKDRQGKPLQELSVHHDRILHVVIASQDFSVFAHIHPEDFGKITPDMKKAARYPVRFTFPKSGRYIIGVDFASMDKLFSKHFVVDVAGEPALGHLTKDFSREKKSGDIDVTISSAPERIKAGKEVTLNYMFRKKGRPVNDLEPYLSAPMHLAIISADLNHFMHTHGEVSDMSGMPGMRHEAHHMEMNMTVPEKFGPRIEVHTVFPAKGLYQIFGQVQHHGKVILTSFMVQVD